MAEDRAYAYAEAELSQAREDVLVAGPGTYRQVDGEWVPCSPARADSRFFPDGPPSPIERRLLSRAYDALRSVEKYGDWDEPWYDDVTVVKEQIGKHLWPDPADRPAQSALHVRVGEVLHDDDEGRPMIWEDDGAPDLPDGTPVYIRREPS